MMTQREWNDLYMFSVHCFFVFSFAPCLFRLHFRRAVPSIEVEKNRIGYY